MVSMRAAAGTACSQTGLKSETGPSGGRGQRERNKFKKAKERESEGLSERKKGKYAGSKQSKSTKKVQAERRKLKF